MISPDPRIELGQGISVLRTNENMHKKKEGNTSKRKAMGLGVKGDFFFLFFLIFFMFFIVLFYFIMKKS